MNYTDYQQRLLDIASGAVFDRLAEARRRAAEADRRERELREAPRRGMLPDVPWSELLREDVL